VHGTKNVVIALPHTGAAPWRRRYASRQCGGRSPGFRLDGLG
jgi:hypothetical protein